MEVAGAGTRLNLIHIWAIYMLCSQAEMSACQWWELVRNVKPEKVWTFQGFSTLLRAMVWGGSLETEGYWRH